MTGMAGAARVHDDEGELDPRVERSRRVDPRGRPRGARRGRLRRLQHRGRRRPRRRRQEHDLPALGREARARRGCLPHPQGPSPRARGRPVPRPAGGVPRAGCLPGCRVDVLDLHARPHRCRRARPQRAGVPHPLQPPTAGPSSSTCWREGVKAGDLPRQQRPRAAGRRPPWADRPASADVRRAVRCSRGALPRRADPAGSATTAEVEEALSRARRLRAGHRSSTRYEHLVRS